MYKEGNVF